MIDLSSVDVEDLLARLDISKAQITASGREVKFSCFGAEHLHGDESPSAYINTTTTAWFCHGCKRAGNAITLVMEISNVSRPTAETMLREWYGIEFDEPTGGSMVAETEARFRPVPIAEPAPRPSTSWLSATRIDWHRTMVAQTQYEEYMVNRGFLPDVLTSWDIGYDYLSDRVTIPVFDLDRELLGFKGRDYTGERQPKYLILGDRPGMTSYGFAPYEAAQVVFGLHRNREHRRVVICEGELNAIALWQMGVPRPIATGMSYFSPRHAELVVREADEVVIFYDAGDAGEIGARAIAEQIEPHMPVRVVQPLAEDPADLLQAGREDDAIELIESATSSLAPTFVFR